MILEYEMQADGLEPVAWYAVSRQYPDTESARAAWEELQQADEIVGGALELGVYRHGSVEAGGVGSLVTAVTHRRDGAEEADRLLAGDDYPLPEEWAQALILRRLDVLASQLSGEAPRTVKIRRPETGAKIHPDGRVEEIR